MEISITCEKRFDVWAVQRLNKELRKIGPGYTKLNIDLSEVLFLDQAAMNLFQELAQQFEVDFSEISPKAKLIFQLTGFHLEKTTLAA